jgi:hypothetical protein
MTDLYQTRDDMKKNVCVDLDGVLAEYGSWKGLDHIGEPVLGAQGFMERLSEYANVIVHTVRCSSEINSKEAPHLLVNRVRKWLDKHGFKYDHIWSEPGKPLADAYVDDRAVPCRPQDFGSSVAFAGAMMPLSYLLGVEYDYDLHEYRQELLKLEAKHAEETGDQDEN